MENDTFQIRTGAFEGPFGLLLELVEKRKLFINDVSLAQVTEDYLNYMNKLGGLNTEQISSFVLVASTLILIKSKSLLPNLNLTTEEEGDIKNLEERLRLYELFTKLSGNVKNIFGEKIIFPAEERKPARLNNRLGGNEIVVFLPDEQITRQSMMTFAKNVLGSMPKKVFLPEVEVKKVISIEEMIGHLAERITSAIKTSFRDMFGKKEKIEAIVGFLAMLELVRQGVLDAMQEDGGDIVIEKLEENYELKITN